MAFRTNYWSSSRIADLIRGTPKLKAATHEGWEQWRADSKQSHPIRFWIAEEGLDRLQNFLYWPADLLSELRHYVNNRWVSRTHALTSNLKKGQWHEFDTRLLHCMFDELVNFVEIEQAWMEVVFSEESRKQYGLPWWRKFPLKIRRWRCPEAGVAHLEWARDLKWNDTWLDPLDPDYGKSTPQAFNAKETLELYRWWKYQRPNRPDPYEVSGWNEWYEQENDLNDQTEEQKAESRRRLDLLHKIEEEYNQEDTDMMIRLIKIRQGLWT